MNQLTDLCCSFELAKEIYDLGFIRESVFNWAVWKDTCMGLTECIPVAAMKLRDGIEFNLVGFNWRDAGVCLIPAYTVGELGDIFPMSHQYWTMKTRTVNTESQWQGDVLSNDKSTHIFEGKSEIDVRAKMLLYFIKNKFIEV